MDLRSTTDDSLECSGYQNKGRKDNQSTEIEPSVDNLHSIPATLPLQSEILETNGFMSIDESWKLTVEVKQNADKGDYIRNGVKAGRTKTEEMFGPSARARLDQRPGRSGRHYEDGKVVDIENKDGRSNEKEVAVADPKEKVGKFSPKLTITPAMKQEP
ncbi:hypothetical protein CcaCcLH18_12790 [Colletotrichum camelliae]|nr:hypothetical protein CcaCcLH18_12790 [Colletotrichum camelliae]